VYKLLAKLQNAHPFSEKIDSKATTKRARLGYLQRVRSLTHSLSLCVWVVLPPPPPCTHTSVFSFAEEHSIKSALVRTPRSIITGGEKMLFLILSLLSALGAAHTSSSI